MPTTISGSTGVTYPAGGLANTAGAGVGTTDTQTLTNKTLGSGLVAGASLLTSGTAVTLTTQTTVDFSSIPSWVKRITVMLADVGMATLNITALIKIGYTGTVVSTGYSNNFIQTNGSNTFAIAPSTTSFVVGFTSNAANTINAVAILNLVGSNIWSYSSTSIESGTTRAHISLGSINLGGTLDILSVSIASSTFDAGTINILYE